MLLFRRPSLPFLIAWAAAFSTSAVVAQTPDPVAHLRVSLFDDAHLPPTTLALAQARATFLMTQAGVDLELLNCPPADPSDFRPAVSPCSVLEWPRHLSVRIVTRAIARSPETFGEAFLDDAGCGVYAKVYYQNLLASRGRLGITEGDMLGFVIAHELGHLLLGSSSHSATGVMQAHWSLTTLHEAFHNNLFFTSAQAATLRSRLAEAPPVLVADARKSGVPMAGVTTLTASLPCTICGVHDRIGKE